MKTIRLTDYNTGKVLKTIKIKDESITFGVEMDRFVVRSYYTNKIIKSVKAPQCSFRYECININ